MQQVNLFAMFALACAMATGAVAYADTKPYIPYNSAHQDLKEEQLLEAERLAAKREVELMANQPIGSSFKDNLEQHSDLNDSNDINILNTPERQGMSEFAKSIDQTQLRMIARQAEHDFKASSSSFSSSNTPEKIAKRNDRSSVSNWERAVDLVSNEYVKEGSVIRVMNFGLDNVANRRIERADEQDVRAGKKSHHLPEEVLAADYGQDLVGRISLAEYVHRWKEQIAARSELYSAQGKRMMCKVFANKESVTIMGRDCIDIPIFERIEARGDENGTLVSLMMVEQLGEAVKAEDMRYFLNMRYDPFDVGHSELQKLASLEVDLCFLMTKMVQNRYKCDVRWFSYAGNHMVYKYSEYAGKKRAIYLFGTVPFFLDVESQLVRRRLALVRQDLERRGYTEKTLMAEKEQYELERSKSSDLHNKSFKSTSGIADGILLNSSF